MDIEIVLPQLGNEIEEAQVESWLAAVGDPVTKGELIAIVATPKVTLEIEAPESGVLKAIHVPADELAAVGAVLGVIQAA
jgi:pyruvate/2-oxoglutarate dehydrogenase complex dihydrolipoamide acyltransferase (E2) component